MVNLSIGFYAALAQRESSCNPRAVNSLGYMGLYQMGRPALQDTGYMDARGNWTGKNGIRSQEDFLNNPADEQTVACRAYHDKLWSYFPQRVKDRVGTNMLEATIYITQAGLIAGGHLLGHGGVTRFIDSNGTDDPQDAYGTHISEYMRTFAIYD